MKYSSSESMVRMVQTSKNRWQLETTKGFVLQGDITVSNNLQAEDFVKNYISSFLNWTYEVVPMKGDSK